jgi:hypothetical protein
MGPLGNVENAAELKTDQLPHAAAAGGATGKTVISVCLGPSQFVLVCVEQAWIGPERAGLGRPLRRLLAV